jgi:hypothetical protein
MWSQLGKTVPQPKGKFSYGVDRPPLSWLCLNHGYLARALVLTDVLPFFSRSNGLWRNLLGQKNNFFKNKNTLFVCFLNLRSILLALNKYLLYIAYFKIIYKNTYK